MKELNNVTYEQTGKTRKCSKFEVKTMTLYIEFCVEHVQRCKNTPNDFIGIWNSRVKKPS